MVAAIAAATCGAAAQELTATQENIIGHLARATYIASKCPAHSTNDAMLGMAMVYAGISPESITAGGPVTRKAVEFTADLMDATDGFNDWTICAVGEILYGPKGILMPELIKPPA